MAALNYLLDAKEWEPNRISIKARPDYASMSSDDERNAFHKVVEAAKGVTVKRFSRPEGPADIRFVELTDPAELARFLGRRPAYESASSSIKTLRQAIGPVSSWIGDVIDEIESAWAIRREGFPGLQPGDVAAAEQFVRILVAVDRGEHLRGWDMRTFSQRACGNSKAVEVGMARLVRALRKKYPLPDVQPKEALASLGIEKFPQPVLIKGHIKLPQGAETIAHPYLGLPPEWAEGFNTIGQPPYVLVTENLASFNRHVREINDEGVVIFSGGFPSRAVLTAIKRLDALLPMNVPFFHWGDTDRHGFLIFQHIAISLTRPLLPHLMDGVEANTEQEALDPRSPA